MWLEHHSRKTLQHVYKIRPTRSPNVSFKGCKCLVSLQCHQCFDWARPALNQCYAYEPPWDFQKLYIALDISWLKEQRDAKNPQATSSTMVVLPGSQSAYCNPRHVQRRFQKHYSKLFNKNKLRCYYCNEPGHFTMNCPKPCTIANLWTPSRLIIHIVVTAFFFILGSSMTTMMIKSPMTLEPIRIWSHLAKDAAEGNIADQLLDFGIDENHLHYPEEF